MQSKTTNPSSKLYLWPKRTLYIGPLPRIKFVQPASLLVISLGEPITVFLPDSDECVVGRSHLISAHITFTAETADTAIAICMLDPLLQDYASLKPKMKSGSEPMKFNIDDEERFVEVFRALYLSSTPQDVAYQRLLELIDLPEGTSHQPDPRIVKVLDMIQSHIDENTSVEIFAKEVGLSVPRLTQLFREQVGTPIRTYRLWHRIFCATVEIAKTKDLSAGAHRAGFSDYAHFNRTFKRMTGMAPTELIAQPNGLELFTAPD